MSAASAPCPSLAAVTIFAAVLGATAAEAQCAQIAAQPVFLAYNPLTAGAKTADFLVTVRNNSCGTNASIRYGIANGAVDANGNQTSLYGTPITYSARLFAQGSPGTSVLLNSSLPSRFEQAVVLSDNQSHQTLVTFLVDERQALPADSLNPSFVVFAYGAEQVTNSAREATVTVTSGYSMTVAGGGSTGLLDYGVLEADEAAKSVTIHTQATGAYRVTLASEQNGVLRNTAVGAGGYTVPYTATLDGAVLDEITPYQATVSSGTILLAEGTAVLPLVIDLDTSGVVALRAGIYRDILTLTISAEP